MKFIPGFEGLYSITDDGQIYAHHRVRRDGRPLRGKWLAQKKDKDGYIVLILTDSTGKTHNVRVHQVVLTVYGPPRPSTDHWPNHKNLNKADNRIDNLEWMTLGDNSRHAFIRGRHYTPFAEIKGELHSSSPSNSGYCQRNTPPLQAIPSSRRPNADGQRIWHVY